MNNKIIPFRISWALTADKPDFYIDEKGLKYLIFNFFDKDECVAINVDRGITLLIPDDNSSIVNQIKNRQEGDYFTTSFSNLEFKPNFLNCGTTTSPWYLSGFLVKENNQLEKIAANEPPLPTITFKVISQKRDDNEGNHLLEIEPLDLGIENLPKIKQILFCFYDNCSGVSTTSKSLKESKFYNSNILVETAGKTFTMKIKHIHLGLKGGKYGNDTLTFQRDTNFEWDSFQEITNGIINPPISNTRNPNTLKTVLIVSGIISGLILIIFVVLHFRKKSSLKK